MTGEVFPPNWPDGPFDVIVADPPWRHVAWSEKGQNRAPVRHYKVQPLDWICSLPVEWCAAKNCMLMLWITGPHLARGDHLPVMKAWGFKGKEASHGVERKHRSPGSIGGHGSEAGNSGGVKKGKRMARRLGGFTTTTRNLDVISVDAERGLLIVKGTVPGPNRGIVTVREAVRLNRRKQTAVKAG